ADAVVLQIPGANLPADGVRRTVGASEDLFGTAFGGALEDALVLSLPVAGDVRKHLVVAASDQVLIGKIVVVQPAFGMRHVPHFSIEHGDRCGGMFYENL